MIVLIDSDSLCYANAFAVEKDGEVVENGHLFMYKKLDEVISTIIHETEADEYKMFLTGKGDFRKDIDPLYKANRQDMRRPELLGKAREYLEIAHGAIVVDGMEADDMVCIEQTHLMKHDVECCIAHIDKDINQQPGWHYKWSIFGKPSEMYEVTEVEGLRNLYTQALVGDKVDNIMYYFNEDSGTWKKDYGLGVKGAEKALADCSTEKEMYDVCAELYTSWYRKGNSERVTLDDLDVNMQLLYMLRHKKDKWRRP